MREIRSASARVAILRIFALALFLTTANAALAQQLPSRALIRAAGAEAAAPAGELAVLRSRSITIDDAVLSRLGFADSSTLNLFNNVSLPALIDEFRQSGPATFHWQGHIAGQPHSRVRMVQHHGAVAAIIRAPGVGDFRIRSARDRGQVVEQIDSSLFPPCGVGPGQVIRAAAPAAQRALAGGVDGPAPVCTIIDVMVVYTPEARTLEGGTSAIEALAHLAVDNTNAAFVNSLVNCRARLVYTGETDYLESGSFFTEVSRLRDPNDGHMDEVHALRDQFGADAVDLLISHTQGGTICGIAYLMSPLDPGFESSAFSVCNTGCTSGGYTFEHELGHNMGCHHDRENAGGPGAFDFSFGYRFTGDDSILYRTIMAYAAQPPGPPGVRIPNFSNPDVLYQGQPTGLPEGHTNKNGDPDSADNARTLNLTAETVAGFRPTPVSGTNWTAPEIIQPLDLQSGDRFGVSVDIDGDFAIVGAYFDDGAFSDTGAAYIYRFDAEAGDWVEQAKIFANDGLLNDRFGVSVAIHDSGDGGGFAVVGAFQTDRGGSDAGSAYIFRRQSGPNSTWVQEAEILAADQGPGDLFGRSVDAASSSLGDVVIIGAYQDDDGGSNTGSAYIFRRSGGQWLQEQKLHALDAVAQDQFGFSVAIAVSPIDGEQWALVGAWKDDQADPFIMDSGSACVFKKTGALWNHVTKLTGPNPAANDQFGYEVDLDITMAGRTAIVSAWLADGTISGEPTPIDTGAAYIFRDAGDGNGWFREGDLRAGGPLAGDRFGSSVAISGDRAMVGAFQRDSGNLIDSGAVFTFHKATGKTGAWEPEATLSAPGALAGDQFGFSAAMRGDYALIGAWQRPFNKLALAGAIYASSATALNDCNTNGIADICDIAYGTSADINNNGIPDECEPPPCPGDITHDGQVNVNDLLAVINAWGPCPVPPALCPADIAPAGSPDGLVNVNDLLAVINAWGACPPPPPPLAK